MTKIKSQIVIVGGGMSGLTTAVYLAREGFQVRLIEKNKECGGLLNSFEREGFIFDAGARALLNSGIIQPMLDDLNINLDVVKSPVTIGIENEIINVNSQESIDEYKSVLEKLYPDSLDDIDKIISIMKKIVKDTATIYAVDNPNFKDIKNDRDYLFKELLPWLPKFMLAIRRINKMNDPVEPFLENISSNRSLTDVIDQHFFKNTPYFFALGYFHVYLDYIYPKGGTGKLSKALIERFTELGGEILNEIEISQVIPSESNIIDTNGRSYPYDYLVWTADLKTFYQILDIKNLKKKVSHKIIEQKEKLLRRRGGDSIFTLFIGVDEPPEKFKSISHGHFFYTPSKKGLGERHRSILKNLIENLENTSKQTILTWLDEFCQLNTYEISIPVLRDPKLAPPGKTGLIVSFLFEYDLINKVQEAGWYDEFRTEVEKRILKTLANSIYPGIEDKLLFRFSSTPISIKNRVGTSEGAITGWSYQESIPVVSNLRKIAKSVRTPIKNVLQAGQWVYSPAGIPTAILTGSFAAKKLIKMEK